MVKTLCYVAQEASDNIVQEKILCSVVLVLLEQHCTGKTLWNVVFEAPDKLAQENIFFNVFLIILGKHSTVKTLMQCCLKDFRQHCKGKKPGYCRLIYTFFQQFLFWASVVGN